MHWYFSEQLQGERAREIRETAHRSRSYRTAARPRGAEREIVIRRSAPDDGAAMSALAALDGREWRSGPALLAEVDGSLRAALPLDGAEPFADPFRASAEIVALLELRARQLSEECRRRRFGPLRWAGAR
jgi:hypothetical protein